MLNKLLTVKVPALFDNHSQGTIQSEGPAYLFIIMLFIVPVLSLIAYFNYWI